MAKNVKISLLSTVNLQTPYNGNMNEKIEEAKEHLAKNIAKVLPDHPDLILLPEICDDFLSFTDEQHQEYCRVRKDRIRDFLGEIAKENRCYIGYSANRWTPEDPKHPYRNSTQIIGRDGKNVGIYDKNHLTTRQATHQNVGYGTEAPVFDLDFGRVGCVICYDLNFEELMHRYAEQKPDLLLFSSMFHGGLLQQTWAYTCRSYFAGAICGDESRILNPFGETVARTTNYYDFITASVNLDYAIVHIDYNGPKYTAAKKKYGELLTVYDPGHIGSVMLTYEGSDQTVHDVIREFDITYLDDYLNESRRHKAEF